MEIRKYAPGDEFRLFELMQEEGPDWQCYFRETAKEKYVQALERSITYIACKGAMLCGYVRCRDDDGFGIYVYDLLVKPTARGRGIGRKLMERVCADYPDDTVYVLSGVDKYYEKLGYCREGSIYKV